MIADDMKAEIIPARPENNRLLVVLVCIVGVISVVSLILAAASFSRKETTNLTVGNSGATCSDSGNDDKIWTFAIGHDGTNLEYIEEVSGTLRGFHVDVVNAVCEVANKNCRLIWDVYENCWTSVAGERARGGPGLMSRWYDACTGWFHTYDRARTFDFTSAFRKPLKGAFFVKTGNPNGFDWTNLTGKTIAFLDGRAQNEQCIASMSDKITGASLEKSQIIHYRTIEAAVEAVNNGEVAALVTNTNQQTTGGELQILSEEFLCVKDGGSMMTGKDTQLSKWWNPAFSLLKETSQYRDICKRVDAEHGKQPGAGGEVICVD